MQGADGGMILVILYERAGVVIIHRERPEICCRDILWQMNMKGMISGKPIAFIILINADVL